MKSPGVATAFVFAAFVLCVSFLPSFNESLLQLTSRFLSNDFIHTSFAFSTQKQNHSTPFQNPSTHPLSNYSPWTHPPVCTPHVPSLSSPLCVYTINTFNNATGLSLFTTPSLAHGFAQLPAILHPSPLPPSPSSPTYHLQPFPSKGHGLIATAPIARLTRLMTTHPVLIMHPSPDLDTMEQEKYLRIALSQLPISAQESYYALAKHYGIPEVAAQDVVKANAFEIGLPLPPGQRTGSGNGVVMHLAIFPTPARLNHDCSPNAMYYLDTNSLTHHVHVTRDIEMGEEISLGYVNVMQERSKRVRMLKEGWGFECRCERCVREGKEEESDEEGGQLQRIKSLEKHLKEFVLRKSEALLSSKNDATGEATRVDESDSSTTQTTPASPPSPPSSSQPPSSGDEEIQRTLSAYLSLHSRLGVEGFMDEPYKLAAVVTFLLSSSSPAQTQRYDQKPKQGHESKQHNSADIREQAKEYARLAAEVMEMRFGNSDGDLSAWKGWGLQDTEEGEKKGERKRKRGAEWVVQEYVKRLRVSITW